MRPTDWERSTAPPDEPGARGGFSAETTGALLREGADRLLAAGSETPRLDAELLLGHAVGAGRTAVLAHPEAPVGADAARRYRADLDRRAAGEPVAYIRGLKEFYGLAFQADARALIPRPETERLVELARTEIMRRLGVGGYPVEGALLRIVDVGTGSGAIAVALAVALRGLRALDAVEILAVDTSPEALELARENAVAHAVADRIDFAAADLLPPDAAAYDLVLANLPYVRSDAMADLPRPTTFEPRLALDGGIDGLEVIGRLLDRLPGVLSEDGVALLEIGGDQGESIVALVSDRLTGWRCDVEVDLAGLPRVARIARDAAG
ncbi:MAG: peptide chain release factor N(5)-glutamine methyltransferase [Chloroflexota bacterium]